MSEKEKAQKDNLGIDLPVDDQIEVTLTVIKEADLKGKDLSKAAPLPSESQTKAKFPRYFLNAMTANIETVKRYEGDLFSDEFELVDTQDRKVLKDRFNLIIKDFHGLSLTYWQKKVVTACFCLIDKQGATAERPTIDIENKSDLYKEVLEKDKKGRFGGQERRLFDEALEELQTQKQQVIFKKGVKNQKGKPQWQYIMVEATLITNRVYNFTADIDENSPTDIKDKASQTIHFNPVIFHGLIDEWRLVPKNVSREIKQACPDVKRVTSLQEDFILFLHGFPSKYNPIRRSRPVLAQELKIDKDYKKNKKRTTEALLQAYEIAKQTGYLTDYLLDEKGKFLIVDVFFLNTDRFEHMKEKPIAAKEEKLIPAEV